MQFPNLLSFLCSSALINIVHNYLLFLCKCFKSSLRRSLNDLLIHQTTEFSFYLFNIPITTTMIRLFNTIQASVLQTASQSPWHRILFYINSLMSRIEFHTTFLHILQLLLKLFLCPSLIPVSLHLLHATAPDLASPSPSRRLEERDYSSSSVMQTSVTFVYTVIIA